MKTKLLFTKLICFLLLAGVISTNYSCAALFDAHLNGNQTIPLTSEGLIDLNELARMADEFDDDPPLGYPNFYVGASGGFGLSSVEGESTTSYCLGAEYNHRVYENNYNSAGYVGGFANYHAESADERDLSLITAGVKYTHFDRITANGEVDLTYGIKAFYETGSSENFGFEEDITGYGAALTIGANYKVSEKFSIGVELPFLTYRQRTYEFEDQEIDESATWLGLNKGNVAMGYARINF